MKVDTYLLLDKWVESIDAKAAIGILKLLKVLRTEGDQYGSNVFITPIKAFQDAGIDQNTYESILFNLHKHKVIEAVNTAPRPMFDTSNMSLSVDSISSNTRIITPLFKYTIDLLQIKTGDLADKKNKLPGELKLNLENIKINIPQEKRYKKHSKIIAVIIEEEGYIPGYKLAQIVKPTIKSKRLNKKDYLGKKDYYNKKIRNLLRTLNPILKQIDHKLGLKGQYWILTSLS